MTYLYIITVLYLPFSYLPLHISNFIIKCVRASVKHLTRPYFIKLRGINFLDQNSFWMESLIQQQMKMNIGGKFSHVSLQWLRRGPTLYSLSYPGLPLVLQYNLNSSSPQWGAIFDFPLINTLKIVGTVIRVQIFTFFICKYSSLSIYPMFFISLSGWHTSIFNVCI